jgi:DnaJ-class molecular chaperone
VQKEFDIKIPEGTQFDQILNVPNCGMPNINDGKRGRMLLKIQIQIPTNLTTEQKESIRKLIS